MSLLLGDHGLLLWCVLAQAHLPLHFGGGLLTMHLVSPLGHISFSLHGNLRRLSHDWWVTWSAAHLPLHGKLPLDSLGLGGRHICSHLLLRRPLLHHNRLLPCTLTNLAPTHRMMRGRRCNLTRCEQLGTTLPARSCCMPALRPASGVSSVTRLRRTRTSDSRRVCERAARTS